MQSQPRPQSQTIRVHVALATNSAMALITINGGRMAISYIWQTKPSPEELSLAKTRIEELLRTYGIEFEKIGEATSENMPSEEVLRQTQVFLRGGADSN